MRNPLRICTENYDIHINDFKKSLKDLLEGKKYSSIAVLVDENTERDCLPLFLEMLGMEIPIIKISSGEIHKNINTCQFIWKQMMELGMGRHSLLLNLGGGVIGDMGGFCASTFKRGIDFIQIPTTLLSQVDASVGGKLGIDFMGIKNSIGVFNDPQTVCIDPIFLKTLPEREIRSGFAEIIKHALIKNENQWQEIREIKDLSQVDWHVFIADSVKIKRDIVQEDPFEKGLRKALNFGHTIGHGIESVFLEKPDFLLHGEAIAIGMICESFISNEIAGLSDKELNSISSYLLSIFGHQPLEKADFKAMISIMGNDKKNIGNKINFTVLNGIGKVSINETATKTLIIKSLEYYNGLAL